MKRSDNGHDPIVPKSTAVALEVESVFKNLPPAEKLDRLLSLYEGIGSKLESTRKDFANREQDIHARITTLDDKIDRTLKLNEAIMSHFGIRLPTEPPPKTGG